MIFGSTIEALKSSNAIFTAQEIRQQPSTWLKTITQIENEREAIDLFIKPIVEADDFDIVLTGAGTSEFVGNAVFAYLTSKFQYKVKSYGTTDLVASPENYLSPTKPTLLVSYGRSGNSPESVGAVEVANVACSNIKHLFITCNHDGALSKYAETSENAYAINLTPETHDQSFAMTSSYSNMYLATILAFQLVKLDDVKKIVKCVVETSNDLLENHYDYFKGIVSEYKFNRIVYLGSNSLKGTAQESALKMLELSAGKTVTMYDTPLGFRHGPKSIINDETLTVIYLSDNEYTYKYELDLIKEMVSEKKGNKILAVSNTFRSEVKDLVDYYYAFEMMKLENIYLGLGYITIAQMLTIFKSLDLNITPDTPCPSGVVNRVVQGVNLYPYHRGE